MFKLLPAESLIWAEINTAFTVTLEGRGPCIDVQMSFRGGWGDLMFQSPLQRGDGTIDQPMVSRFLQGFTEARCSSEGNVQSNRNVLRLQRKSRGKGLGKDSIDFFFLNCLNHLN